MIGEAFKCCAAPDAAHQFAPSRASRASRVLGPEVGQVELATEPVAVDAIHEAAHAALVVAVGVTVIGLVATGQPKVSHTSIARPLDEAVVAVAGPIGQRWRDRHVFIAPDGLLAGYSERSRCGGGCDTCIALRALRRAVPDIADRELYPLFRQVEAAVLGLIRRPSIWRAIEEIADAAMKYHALLGDEVEEVCAKYFQPGSFRLELQGLTVIINED